MPRLHSGATTDRPEVTHLILPPIPEVVWQQPQENHVNNIHNDLTKEIQNDTHTPKQKNDVEAQTSPIKETSPQKSGSDTESSLENQTRRIPVQYTQTSKPTIVLTDNKSVTRFFQTKAIPPSLWNACDYVLQFNFKIAHIAGSVNTAADFLSRLELKVTEKIHLKIREDVQTTPIEVSTSSSDVADEEQFFFTQPDSQDETEQEILQRKEPSQKNAAEWVINQELSSIKPSIKEFTKIDGNTTSYSINGIKANARLRVEQDADLVLKNLKLKILGQPHDDVLLTTDRRFKHYKANEDRIILKDRLLFRKNYGETGSVKYYQVLIPKQLVNEVLQNLHGDFAKHPGITKTIIAYREK